ncbi:MAG: metallophosphoesterase family protein [Candidatus Omnitrophota bacterium]
MRYAIFSDVHGNIEALDAVIQSLRTESIEQYFCLGDIVGYGANPEECIEAVQRLPALSIAGNHDWAVLEKIDVRHFNSAAREAVFWTRRHLSESGKAFLQSLELLHTNDEVILAHGTLQHPGEFLYLLDLGQAGATFRLMDRQVCFIGHTHIPQVIIECRGKASLEKPGEVRTVSGCRYIINVGSVGQPRDRDPRAAYCIYDTETQALSIRRVDYPIEKAQQKISQSGLPNSLASRLAEGV